MIGSERPFFAGSPGTHDLEPYRDLRCVRVPGMPKERCRFTNDQLARMLEFIDFLVATGQRHNPLDGLDCPLEWGP